MLRGEATFASDLHAFGLVGYGIERDAASKRQGPAVRDQEEALRRLREMGDRARGRLRVVEVGNTHEKIVVCDDQLVDGTDAAARTKTGPEFVPNEHYTGAIAKMLEFERRASEAEALAREHARTAAAELERRKRAEDDVAAVGETGVGKTSTINALFGKGLDVSHARACTHVETEIVGERGRPVRVFDMPGLGEDLDADEEHFETYRRVLRDVDAVIWILKADNRAMTNVQCALARLVREDILVPSKLVIALNQVDLVQPGMWDRQINLPSSEQERTIAKRREDVLEKIRKVVEFPERNVVAYSARTFFNLDALLELMLDACDETRRWLLHDRACCADFNTLVDEPSVKAE